MINPKLIGLTTCTYIVHQQPILPQCTISGTWWHDGRHEEKTPGCPSCVGWKRWYLAFLLTSRSRTTKVPLLPVENIEIICNNILLLSFKSNITMHIKSSATFAWWIGSVVFKEEKHFFLHIHKSYMLLSQKRKERYMFILYILYKHLTF